MKLEELTALYSPLDIEYSQVMSGPYEDLSYHGEDCTVIAGLKDGRISGFWRPVVAVGDEKTLKIHIERLYDTCRNIYYMDFLIDGRLSVISQFLLRQGYKARPYYTQIIDLTKNNIHSDLRKSYKSLINKTTGIIPATVSEYRVLHEKIKGRKRSDASWQIQEKTLPVCNIQGGKGALFHWYRHAAYYFSAVGNDNHAIVWSCIKRLQQHGCKFVEMGEQIFHGDPKLVNISKYKRGFGGVTVTRLILEKV